MIKNKNIIIIIKKFYNLAQYFEGVDTKGVNTFTFIKI